jgi:hypothetical protein
MIGALALALALLCASPTPCCSQPSYASQVLLPTMHAGLDSVMEHPFETIRFTETEVEMGFLETTTERLRQWLYHQVVTLHAGDPSRSSITMVYVGLEDGRFLGYFSSTSYTERAGSGNATDLDWAPYTLDTINDAVADGEIKGVSGKVVADSCAAGERESACTSQDSVAVDAVDKDACLQTAGNTWYAPCTVDCCDAHVRNYYSTSVDARGRPLDVTRWRVYDHKARPWYKQCKYHLAEYSKPYEFSTSQSLGLTAMAAARDETGELLGVFAIDYEVGGLSTVLNRSLSGPGSWGYAVERSNGKLVALSTAESLYNSTLSKVVGFSASRLSATAAGHSSIAVSATILAALDWPTGFYHRSESTLAGYEFQTKNLSSHGLDWLVVAGQDINCQPSQVWASLAGVCQTCDAGSVPVDGRCTVCPLHSTPNGDLSACHCATGYYSLPGDTECFACPPSLVCGGGLVGSTWPLPKAGWWYDYELFASTTGDRQAVVDEHVFQCISSYNCMGSADGKTCNDNGDISQRGVGYSCCSPTTSQNSTLCGLCQPGFAAVAGRCSKCDEADIASVLTYLLVYCSLIVVLWFRSAAYRCTSNFGTLVLFLQHLALQLDDSVHRMRFFTSLVLLDLDPISADQCLMDIGFAAKWMISIVWLPLFLATLLCVLCILDHKCIYPGRLAAGNIQRVLPPWIRLKKSLFELLMILVFPACLWGIKATICRSVNGRHGKVTVLNDDSSMECYGPGHMPLYTASVILLFLYCAFAIAMLFAIGLRRFRQERKMVAGRGRALDKLLATDTRAQQLTTPAQSQALNDAFGQDENLSSARRATLSESIGVTEQHVREFFSQKRHEKYSEPSGSAEVRACLSRLVRRQPPQLRVKTPYESQEQGKLQLHVGQRILLQEGEEGEQTWIGSALETPDEHGEFPRDCVDVISAESFSWNAEMASRDPLASSFYPLRVSCFWYPGFLLLVRFVMLMVFTAGSVRRFDGKVQLSDALFEEDTEDTGEVILAQIDWKAFATLLLTLHLLVQLKYLPFWHDDQNDFESLSTVTLLITGLCFLGTEHDQLARFLFFTIMFFFVAAVVWIRRRGFASTTPDSRARKNLRNVLLKLRVGMILVSWHRRECAKPSASAEPESSASATERPPPKLKKRGVREKLLFEIDESCVDSETQKKEIEKVLAKNRHTDDFAANELEILTKKLRNDEWPALRALHMVGGGRRPQDCLELLEAMLYLREPLHTLVIDLSQQDPVILEVVHNLCVQETLQSIADSFTTAEEPIELNFRRARHGLTHALSPHKDYAFTIRGPILQYSEIGMTSRMTPLAHLGSCSVELIESDGGLTIKFVKDERPLFFLAQTDDGTEDELRLWEEHVAQVCKDFKHRDGELRQTINIAPFLERPLELCVYLADCSMRLIHLFPTEADDLQDLAEQFEQHACSMIDQCESGAEAEAVLRSAGTALLNGADVYNFAMESGLKSVMSVNLVKQYTEDVWTRADVHLHRTGIDDDLKREGDPEGVALARLIKVEDKRFQRAVGVRVGPVAVFPVLLVIGICATAAECMLIVLISPLAEVLWRSDRPTLACFCRKRLAMMTIGWSYPLIKCYMALILHLCVLALVLSAASQYSPIATQTEFSWAETGIYLYALGFFLAELFQLKNLLLERLRVQSLHEAYLLAVQDWDDTIPNLMVAMNEYTRAANQLDLVIIALFGTNYVLRRQELQIRVDNLDHWTSLDGQDSSDSSRYVFGVNILLLVLRFLDLCSFNRHLGPLWITLQSMIQDILLFSFIAVALIIAFSGCLQVVFWRQPDLFFYSGDTVEFVLMTFFGEYDTEALYEAEPIWGRIIMVTLLVLGTIVQLNLLIAMLTSTYEDKKDHSAAEWRLVRTRIVVEFSDAVRSVLELPLLNVIYAVGAPILQFLCPAVWSASLLEEKSSEDWLRSPPVLRTGLPYHYNDRRSLYLENTVDIQGELSVVVHQAQGLREATELDRLNEPYCTCRIGPQQQQTDVVQEREDEETGQRIAIWEEEVKLTITQRLRHPLQITLYDSDKLSQDDVLGRVQLELSKKLLDRWTGGHQQWYSVRSLADAGTQKVPSSTNGSVSALDASSSPESVDLSNEEDLRRTTTPMLSGIDSPDDGGCGKLSLSFTYTPVRQAAGNESNPTETDTEPTSLPTPGRRLDGRGFGLNSAVEVEITPQGSSVSNWVRGGFVGTLHGDGTVDVFFDAEGQDRETHVPPERLRAANDFSTQLDLTFMMRDYRHPFVTFYEKPRKVHVRSGDTVGTIIEAIFAVQQQAIDVNMKAEGWRHDNIILAHVPRECLSDMRYFVGPFQEKLASASQRCTTLLLDRSKRLREYFSIGRRPAVVERLLRESVFLLLRNDKDGMGWAFLRKNPQQELHLRSQQQAEKDRSSKLVMKLGKEPIDMDLAYFTQQHDETQRRFNALEEQLKQMGAPSNQPATDFRPPNDDRGVGSTGDEGETPAQAVAARPTTSSIRSGTDAQEKASSGPRGRTPPPRRP